MATAPAGRSLDASLATMKQQWTTLSAKEWMRLHDISTPAPVAVSNHVTSFFLTVSMEFHNSVCPSDHAFTDSSLVVRLQRALTQSCMEKMAGSFHSSVMTASLSEASLPSLLQLSVDVGFVQEFLRQCITGASVDEECRTQLEDVAIELDIHTDGKQDDAAGTLRAVTGRLFLSNVAQHEIFLSAFLRPLVSTHDQSDEILVSSPILEPTCRFALLPLPSERQLQEILMQAREKNSHMSNNKKEFGASAAAANAANSSTASGFGFFTSMTSKWKK